MPATLLTSAAGHGKTRFVIDHIARHKAEHPLDRVWVLMPSELQINSLREQLIENKSHIFGIEFFNFNSLYTRLLDIAGVPQRRVKNGARFRILQHVISQVEGELGHFNRIAQKPGFLAILEDFIDELKQGLVDPADYLKVATSAKDRDLALLYLQYNDYLRSRNLADQEGEGWLSLVLLRENPSLDLKADLLIVDGYDQFNLIQAELLALLGERLPETIITLTYQAARAETAHRRFTETRRRLLATGTWDEQSLITDTRVDRVPLLEQLSRQIFETRVEKIPADATLILIEAPDRRREVGAVLRRVKRLLLDGTPPDNIMIVARGLTPYTGYLLETAPAYGVPLAMRGGLPLSGNPAIGAFLSLIGLADADFQRRAVIDTLRSPYLLCSDFRPEQIDQLDRISQTQIVVRGRKAWLEAIEVAGQIPDRYDEENEVYHLPEADAAVLRASIASFFDRITPPVQATPRDYVTWLESLIGPDPSTDPVEAAESESPESENEPVSHFQILRQIRAETEKRIESRDLIAFAALKTVIEDVFAAYELVDAGMPVDWAAFRFDLLLSITQNHQTISTNRLGRVLVASVYEARGLPHQHVFVLGLSEGEFPAATPEDPFYTDDERRKLALQGIPLLTRTQAADESSLFYEMTALAQQTLTLTRPYVDDKGNDWPASPYWRAVRGVIEVAPERIPIASGTSIQTAAQLSEVFSALAEELNDGLPNEAARVHNWLIATHQESWRNALLGRWIESRRLSLAAPHDEYTGKLSDEALIARVGQLLGPNRVWSASQFNEYGTCAYRFFARRMLKLEEFEEPEEGMNALQLGSLLHEILEHTYDQIRNEQLQICAENRDRALQILDEKLNRLLPNAPRRYAFRQTPLWGQEQGRLRSKLRALITQDFSEDSPVRKFLDENRYTFGQEIAFGDGKKNVAIDGAAGPLKVRGKIDRVDISGDSVVVLDYKTGSSPYPVKEMVEGRNVQMMLYILAAQQVLDGIEPIGGMFWHLGTRKSSGAVAADDPQIEEARKSLHERVIEGRQGIFVNAPTKPSRGSTGELKCVKHCEYNQLCRVNSISRGKRR